MKTFTKSFLLKSFTFCFFLFLGNVNSNAQSPIDGISGDTIVCGFGLASYYVDKKPNTTYTATVSFGVLYKIVQLPTKIQIVVSWNRAFPIPCALIVTSLNGGFSLSDTLNVRVLDLKPKIIMANARACMSKSIDTTETGAFIVEGQINEKICSITCDSTCEWYYGKISTDSSILNWIIKGDIMNPSDFTFGLDSFYHATGDSIKICWGKAGNYSIGLEEVAYNKYHKTVYACVEVKKSPKVLFGVMPGPVVADSISLCNHQSIEFIDLTPYIPDLEAWEWDFGDGSTLSGVVETDGFPPTELTHVFPHDGRYIVTLTYTTKCGCTGRHQMIINISIQEGVKIVCPASVCTGDTAEYSTQDICTSYNWTIIGGTIVSGGPPYANKIKVLWGSNPSTGYVTLDGSPCSKPCHFSTTVRVPIITPSIKLNFPRYAKIGEIITVSLPKYPGVIYKFKIRDPAACMGCPEYYHQDGLPKNFASFQMPPSVVPPRFFTAAWSMRLSKTASECAIGLDTIYIQDTLNIIGPDTVCVGATANYTTSKVTPNIDTFFVDGPHNAIFTNVTNFNYTFTSPGIYKISLIDKDFGTYEDKIVFVIGIDPPDDFISKINVCPGLIEEMEVINQDNEDTEIEWDISTNGTIIASVGNKLYYRFNSTIGTSFIKARAVSTEPPFCTSTWITQPIYFDIVPKDTSLPDTVCENSVFTYHYPFHTADVYEWTSLNNQLVSITSGFRSDVLALQFNSLPSSSSGTIAKIALKARKCNIVTLDTIKFWVKNILNITITGPGGNICQNTSASFSCSHYGVYSWEIPSFASITSGQDTSKNVSISFSKTGTFNIFLNITQIGDGCQINLKIPYQVTVLPQPNGYMSTPQKINYCTGVAINNDFYATVIGAGTYTFQFYRNGSAISITNPNNTTLTGTYYYVITDSITGCSLSTNSISIDTITCGGTGCNVPSGETIGVTYTVNCDDVTLSNSDTGCWTSPSFTLLTTGGTTIISNTSAGIHFKVNQAGYYKINYANLNCNSCTRQIDTAILVPLVADFDISALCDTGGRKIYLHDLSTVCNTTVASVSWSVAGGGTYSGSSVIFLANAAGTYIVTMTVTDGLGNSCSKINSITLPGMPAADFTISPSSIICKGKAFHFTDASTGSIIFWKWRYGDYSEYYSYTTSSKQYLSVGINWQNTLFVFDSFSCIDSIDKFTTTAQNPLNGIIQPDSIYVCEGTPISLTCLHIPALGFTPNYLWSNGETTNPATDITAAGLYRVTVLDNNYCDLIPEKDAKVMFYPNPPLSIVGDDTVCMYQKFKKKVIPKGHGIYHWEREIFDVSTGLWLNNATRVGKDLTTFRDSAFIPGLYRYFILYFGDTPLSCTSLSDTVYTWVVDTPTINITDSTVLCHPFKVRLKANTSGPSNSPFDIRWSQGGYGRTIITNRSGLYGALFTDKYGCRAKDTISVQGPPDFSSLPSFCLDICDTSLNTGNYWLPIYIPGNFDTWDWEKELLPGIFTSISSGIGKLPDSVNIIAAARYRLTIKLRGCIYYSELIDVNIIKCTCGCNIQSEFIDTILPIDSCMHHFLAKSILDTCTSLIQYDWFTTYGTTRINSDTFSHRYSKAYERVCLVTRAYDNTTSNYCSDTLCRGRSQSDTLCLKKCQCNVFASFVVDVDSCYAELSIDSIPFDTCDAIYTYHWNFGDGNVYDGLYPPSHHYKMNGRYYACLIVTRINPMGNSCADTFCRYVCITDCSCHCDVSIIQNKTNVATNMNCSQVFSFTPFTSTCGIIDVIWDFGDSSPIIHSSLYSLVLHKFPKSPFSYMISAYCVMVDTNGDTCIEQFFVPFMNNCTCNCDNYALTYSSTLTTQCKSEFLFDNITNYAFCNTTDVLWDINWGDGTKERIPAVQNPIGHVLRHNYLFNGTYDVCITIYSVDIGGDSCLHTYCTTASVTCPACSCPPHISDLGHMGPNILTFTDLSNCEIRIGYDVELFHNCPIIDIWYRYGDGTIGRSSYHLYKWNSTYTVCAVFLKRNIFTNDTCYEEVCTNHHVSCPCFLDIESEDEEGGDTSHIEETYKIIIEDQGNSKNTTGYKTYLFPNPANDIITIKVIGLYKQRWKLSIFNELGKELMHQSIAHTQTTTDLSVLSLSSGHYTAFVTTETGEIIGRIAFIVKH